MMALTIERKIGEDDIHGPWEVVDIQPQVEMTVPLVKVGVIFDVELLNTLLNKHRYAYVGRSAADYVLIQAARSFKMHPYRTTVYLRKIL